MVVGCMFISSAIFKSDGRQKVMKVDSKTPQDPWSWGDSRQQVMKVYNRQKVMKVDRKTASNESL